MLKFKLKPESAWVGADHSLFDRSEIGFAPIEERKRVQFRINPLTSKMMDAIRETKDEDMRKAMQEIGFSIKAGSELSFSMMSKILSDWRGVLDESGNAVPFSIKTALDLFENGYSILGGCIIEAAKMLTARFEELNSERRDGEIKNSGASQNGLGDETKR